MQRKTDIEMERIKIAKTVRALVRLKYSLKADEELNELLPDTLIEFENSIQQGELKTLDLQLLRDALES